MRVQMKNNSTIGTDPDVILMTETKIDSSASSSEFLPCGYKGDIRRDREEGGDGGVMIATKENITIEPLSIDSKCESAWCKISLKDKSDQYIGCFYRRPNEYTPTQVEDLEQDLRHIEALTRNNDGVTDSGRRLQCPWHWLEFTHSKTRVHHNTPVWESPICFCRFQSRSTSERAH